MQLLAGRYRLDGPVGSGGMAVVHRAYDIVLRRTVAIKMLRPEHSADADFRAAVRREALAAAQLSHPNIANVYDYGETGDDGTRQPFLVLEFVTGGTLATRLARQGPLPWQQAAQICAGVAGALAYAHAHQLVHRDIKPGNVMVSRTGVKVVDFGLAALVGQTAVDADGRLWGTPAYLAPEQLNDERVAAAADMYALGLLFQTCLTNRPPWPGSSVSDVLAAAAAPAGTPPGLPARHATGSAADLPELRGPVPGRAAIGTRGGAPAARGGDHDPPDRRTGR